MNEAKKGVRKPIYTVKTKNPVAKAHQAVGSGSGAHKDKKKAAKQGDSKHKKDYAEGLESALSTRLDELKDTTKASYKEKATSQVKELEPHAKKGEYKDLAQRAIDRRKKGLSRVKEDSNPEYDDESGMSYGSLHTIARAATGLLDTIQDGDNLPEWCQEKISLAEDYLVTVWDYLQSEKEQGVAEGSLEELANTSLKVKEPKDFVNTNDRKQVTYKVMKFKSGKDTYLINFTVKGAPAFGKKSNWNAVNVAFGVKEKQDDYSFGDEMNTDLTAKNKNQFLIYSTVINAIRKFITEYNTEIDEIIMQGAGERQEAMYQRFFQSAGKYFPGWHHDGKHSLVRDVPRQKVKKVREQGVAEGLFGIDDKIKGKIQNVVSDLSDIPGMWDHKAQTFTDTGMDKLKTVLKNNPKYIKYALNLDYRDYEAEGVAEGAKVDRMVKHIKKSEKSMGKSDKKATDIAWATANKRGMLDNKNKKTNESWTHDSLADRLFEHERTYEDKLANALAKQLGKK